METFYQETMCPLLAVMGHRQKYKGKSHYCDNKVPKIILLKTPGIAIVIILTIGAIYAFLFPIHFQEIYLRISVLIVLPIHS